MKRASGEGLSVEEARRFVALGADAVYDVLAVAEKVRRKHKGSR